MSLQRIGCYSLPKRPARRAGCFSPAPKAAPFRGAFAPRACPFRAVFAPQERQDNRKAPLNGAALGADNSRLILRSCLTHLRCCKYFGQKTMRKPYSRALLQACTSFTLVPEIACNFLLFEENTCLQFFSFAALVESRLRWLAASR
jgi:hypothetical protein